MSEENTEQKENGKQLNGEEKLPEYVTEAMRGPKFGIFEQLLCQNLVQAAITTDPLRKVQCVTDATLMLGADKQKNLDIDADKASVIKSICTAFQHRIVTSLKQHLRPLVTIKFGFPETEENFDKYIKPWYNAESVRFFPEFMPKKLGEIYLVWFCRTCGNEVSNKLRGDFGINKEETKSWSYVKKQWCKFCGADLEKNLNPYTLSYRIKTHEKTSEAEYTFGVFTALSEEGYVALENDFLQWCLPFILELMRKLTEAVRPEIYREIAKMFIETKKEQQNDYKG